MWSDIEPGDGVGPAMKDVKQADRFRTSLSASAGILHGYKALAPGDHFVGRQTISVIA